MPSSPLAGSGGSRDLWTDGLPSAPLTPEDIHVIRIALEDARPAAHLLAALDETEKERAYRFVFDRDRRQFIISHAALRTVLGRCLDVPPTEIRFRSGPNGKPSLANVVEDVRFNLSHSGDCALLAVAVGREVGVDVEKVRPVDVSALAQRYFSLVEARSLGRRSDEALEAFFRCWTRKESFIKALGDGLSFALDTFSVSIDAAPGPVPIICDDVVIGDRWTMLALPAPPGYAAAVTFAAGAWQVKLWAPSALADVGED